MTFLSEDPPTRRDSTQSSRNSTLSMTEEQSITEEPSAVRYVDRTKLMEDAVRAVKRLGASTANADSTRELRELTRKYEICVQGRQSVEQHRGELLAHIDELKQQNLTVMSEYSKLRAINQHLGKKVEKLDAMRKLLGS